MIETTKKTTKMDLEAPRTDGILLDITRIDIEDDPQKWDILNMQHILFRPTQIWPAYWPHFASLVRDLHTWSEHGNEAPPFCAGGCFCKFKRNLYTALWLHHHIILQRGQLTSRYPPWPSHSHSDGVVKSRTLTSSGYTAGGGVMWSPQKMKLQFESVWTSEFW